MTFQNRFFWLLLVLAAQTLVFASCGEKNNKNAGEEVARIEGITIEVDISNTNCLAILLHKDGTINRKGSGVVDSLDKNFFMGVTNDKIFDSLLNSISKDLLNYRNIPGPICDTTKQTCTVKMGFGNNESSSEIDYCVNGTINDLPKPIKKYIETAVRFTDPWYERQKKLH